LSDVATSEGANPQLVRSTLVVPGNRLHMIQKAATLEADALMIDWEDAVAYTASAKQQARDLTIQSLAETDFGRRQIVVRINPPGSPWFEDDLEAISHALPHPRAILATKVSGAGDILTTADALDAAGVPSEVRIWATIDTASALLRSSEIATASARVELLRFGFGDYTVSMHGQFAEGDEYIAYVYPLTHVLAVARDRGHFATAAAVAFSDIRNLDLIKSQALFLRRLGYDGATVIHPSHLPVVNEVFTPSAAEIADALRYEQVLDVGDDAAVAIIDGHLVEHVHLEQARRTLRIARALGITAA
jgi:citrate lyase subunit beta / citryl-CoA lyase